MKSLRHLRAFFSSLKKCFFSNTTIVIPFMKKAFCFFSSAAASHLSQSLFPSRESFVCNIQRHNLHIKETRFLFFSFGTFIVVHCTLYNHHLVFHMSRALRVPGVPTSICSFLILKGLKATFFILMKFMFFVGNFTQFSNQNLLGHPVFVLFW